MTQVRSPGRPRILYAAPHRLAFLIGSVNLAGLAWWWLGQIAQLHLGPVWLPQTTQPPALLHGPVMLYFALAPFIFGFLMTVFPRWMALPDLGARQFGPVATFLAAAAILLQAGLWSGHDGAVLAGFTVQAIAWLGAIVALGGVLRRHHAGGPPPCWHGWSIMPALVLGLAGLLAATTLLATGDPALLPLANRLGIGGFVLPVFLTVAHRMVPFFAGNVVAGYARWRPGWLLALIWALLLARLAGELLAIGGIALIANGALALLTGLMAWKWWPRGPAPGLLMVLLWGFAWAPLGFALAALDNGGIALGRAPDHALLIGFAASMLVGMVTRVTQGHSGRPLEMTASAWLAFAAVQLAAVTRTAAALAGEDGRLLVLAALAFAMGLLPWVLRHGAIYAQARRDGKPG